MFAEWWGLCHLAGIKCRNYEASPLKLARITYQ